MYSILDSVLPISFINNNSTCNLTVANKVIVICCALVNICILKLLTSQYILGWPPEVDS